MKKYYEPDVVSKHIKREPIPEEVRVQYLRPGEILSIQDTFPVAFQPIGTLEWHGRHNPIGCDALKAEALCIETAKNTGGVVMPPIYFGCDGYNNYGHGVGYGMDAAAGFALPGSYYQTEYNFLIQLLINASANYLNRGFKMVVIISGHNAGIQKNAINEVCYKMKTPEGKEPVAALFEYEPIAAGNRRRTSDHAGGYETSMMLYLAGDRTNIGINQGQEPYRLALSEDFPYEEATAEEGKIRLTLQTEGLCKWVKEKYNLLNGETE